MALVAALVLLTVALPLAALDGGPSVTKHPDPLAEAAGEFKVLTRDLGMRPDSPPSVQQQHARKNLWHGRLYENFRNDVLDAIPHEVRQNGESNSPVRTKPAGFGMSFGCFASRSSALSPAPAG